MRSFQLRNTIPVTVASLLLAAGMAYGQKLQFKEIEKNMVFDNSAVQSVNGVVASFAPALENATPAVVTIFSKSDPTAQNDDALDPREEMLRRLLGLPGPGGQAPGQSGLGSGVILSADGYILTNNHVVEGADRITVALKDNKREYVAKLIGGDKDTDVAIIKIEAQNLTPMKIGDSSKVKVGDVVLAVGNPLGLEQTVTHGIVSALGRRRLGITGNGGYENFIQTDASINVGNSGGALIDAQGRLIGMNTAIKTDGLSRGNLGIAFAIPSNMALSIVKKLVDGGGAVRRGFLGIELRDVSEEDGDELKLSNLEGAYVNGVNPATPAESAGIKQGDVIVELDGKAITDSAQLRLDVSSKDPGVKVDFKIIREGKTREFSVVLGDKDELLPKVTQAQRNQPRRQDLRRPRNNDPLNAPDPVEPPQNGGNESGFLAGVKIQELDGNLRSALKLDETVTGVFVASVDEKSKAAEAGLEAGQIITQVDQQNVGSAAVAEGIVSKFEGEVILLQIYKDGRRSILAVPLN